MEITNKKIIPKIAYILIGAFILYATLSAINRSNELNTYGKFGVARLVSTDNAYKGEKVLYFELNVNGKLYKMDNNVNLTAYTLIDSFYQHGLPLVYSYKDPSCHSLLITKDDFSRFNIEIPSEFNFLP